MHIDYPIIANWRTEMFAVFRGTYGIFRDISKLLFIHDFCGTSNDVLRTRGWETLD
jgi:hypothetical protein